MREISIRKDLMDLLDRRVREPHPGPVEAAIYTGVRLLVSESRPPAAQLESMYFWVLSDDQRFKTGGKAYGWPYY